MPAEDIMINYTPFGHSDWQTIVSDIKSFASAGKKTAVVSTVNGDANVPFYKELGNQGIKAEDIPVVAFSVGEEELAGIDTGPLVGHLAAWNYFMSVDAPENEDLIKKWHAFIGDEKRVTNDPDGSARRSASRCGRRLVQQAGTTDVDRRGSSGHVWPGSPAPARSGFDVVMNTNHHLSKPVLIGEIQDDGQFAIGLSHGDRHGVVVGDAWS